MDFETNLVGAARVHLLANKPSGPFSAQASNPIGINSFTTFFAIDGGFECVIRILFSKALPVGEWCKIHKIAVMFQYRIILDSFKNAYFAWTSKPTS